MPCSRQKEQSKCPHLTTETIEGTSLPLQSINDIQRSNGLPLGVLGIRDGITNDTLEERLEHTTRLFVDHGGNTLDAATAGETTDGRLGDALDVVAENLAMAFGAAFAEAFAALAACDESC